MSLAKLGATVVRAAAMMVSPQIPHRSLNRDGFPADHRTSRSPHLEHDEKHWKSTYTYVLTGAMSADGENK
jgi:hypothetical protein